MAQTAEADAAKIAEVTDILDKQVLALGRDALMWLEKIKRLHQQITLMLAQNHPSFFR